MSSIRRSMLPVGVLALIGFVAGCSGDGSGGSEVAAPPPAGNATPPPPTPTPPPPPPTPRNGEPPPAAPGQFLLFQTGSEVYKYDLDTDSAHLLSPPETRYMAYGSRPISPDGRSVAFVAFYPNATKGDLLIAPVDGSKLRRVSQLPLYSLVEDFEWSPDSVRIAYRAAIASEYDENAVYESYGQIFVVDRNGANHRPLSSGSADAPVIEEPTVIQWSADSRFVSYSVTTVDRETYAHVESRVEIHDLQASGPPEILKDISYAWSPQGSRLAYVAGSANLYTMNPNGTDVAHTTLGSRLSSIVWSPDGSRIAFLSNMDSDDIHALYTVAPDGTALTEVSSASDGEVVYNFSWAPDGSRLAYTARVGSAIELYGVRPDGSDHVKLNVPLADGDSVSLLKWAGDSARVAYVIRHSNGMQETDTVRADGTEHLEITSDLSADPPFPGGKGIPYPISQHFEWSPDGSRIAYLSDELTSTVDLYAVRTDGSENFKLNDPLAAGMSLRFARFAWSADGSRVAYLADEDGDRTPDVYVAAPNGATYRNVSRGISQEKGGIEQFMWSPVPR